MKRKKTIISKCYEKPKLKRTNNFNYSYKLFLAHASYSS